MNDATPTAAPIDAIELPTLPEPQYLGYDGDNGRIYGYYGEQLAAYARTHEANVRAALAGGLCQPLASAPEWKDSPVYEGNPLCAGVAATQAVGEPVAKVLFRQDEDGLEPVMFYGPGTEPDPATLKDRFVIRDVWLAPPTPKATEPAPGAVSPDVAKMVAHATTAAHNLARQHLSTDLGKLINLIDALGAAATQARAAVGAERSRSDEPLDMPEDDAAHEAWVSACEVDGIKYSGSAFERGYELALSNGVPEWPTWAHQVLKITREHSGYDGYDDQDGIDLVEEVRECMRELAAMADRARAALSAQTSGEGWISVEDARPKFIGDDNTPVFTWDGKQVRENEYGLEWDQPAGPVVGGWVVTGEGFQDDTLGAVTHWMPRRLPNPPATPTGAQS